MRNKLIAVKMKAVSKLAEVLSKKNAGVDGIVVVIGLCFLGVAILVITKTEVGNIIKSLVADLANQVKALITT